MSVPVVCGREADYVKECLDTGWVSSVGSYVSRFEEEVASYVGAAHAVAVVNGTAALHMALLVAGIGEGDEVLVPTLTFIATANAVRYTGASPVLIDAEPVHWQMDPELLKDFLEKGCSWKDGRLTNRKSSRRVRAIMPVHLLGHPVDMDSIMNLARKYDLLVIEDATESMGSSYKGARTGTLGDMACFSFNGNKIITCGGGGMLVTENREWAARARHLTTQAKADPVEYIHDEVGYNYRLTNIQAAMGCAQLDQLNEFIKRKRAFAARYNEGLREVPGLELPKVAPWAEPNGWLYGVQVREELFGMDSRGLMTRLREHRIEARPVWQPLHLSPVYRDVTCWGGEVAASIYHAALTLPSSVGMTAEEQARVVASIGGAARAEL